MISTSFGHCWIKFENGYTISIFNGFGSYSEDSVIGFITPDELPELMMKVKEADNIEL